METTKNDLDFERAVLQKMHARKRWGKFHIRRDTVVHSGFPSHLRGEISKAVDSLIKKGWISYHDKSKDAICLNLAFREEILRKITEGNNIK